MTFLNDQSLNSIIKLDQESWNKISDITKLNQILEEKTGIINFFDSEDSIEEYLEYITNNEEELSGKEKVADLGDFQTPLAFSDEICERLEEE